MTHYEYGCEQATELRRMIANKLGKREISQRQWRLEEALAEQEMIVIAKVRWIYHCERCKIDHGERKIMNLRLIMQKLNKSIEIDELVRSKK